MNIADLETLDYPPHTADLEEAKAHLDEYGMALIENVLTAKEVEEMDQRLNEQFLGEEKHQVGSEIERRRRFRRAISRGRKSQSPYLESA